MNRKNTILIAVVINAGLLAVLLIAALTTQDELPSVNQIVAEAPLPPLPKFDEPPMYQPLPTPPQAAEAPEPVLHKLPPLIVEPAPVAAAVVPAPSLNEVTVKKGDTLDKIAKSHRTTVDEIIKINHLPSSFLKVGQVLKIPTLASEKKPAAAGPEYYTIKVGDNPWAIANKHHMKVEELLRLNSLNEERARKLKAGDRLRIR